MVVRACSLNPFHSFIYFVRSQSSNGNNGISFTGIVSLCDTDRYGSCGSLDCGLDLPAFETGDGLGGTWLVGLCPLRKSTTHPHSISTVASSFEKGSSRMIAFGGTNVVVVSNRVMV